MKFTLFAGMFGVFSTVVSDAAIQVVAITGALAGAGWFWTRIILPAARTLRGTYRAVDALADLGPFMEATRTQADLTDRRLDLLERHMHLYAAEDAAAIRRAIRPHEEGT